MFNDIWLKLGAIATFIIGLIVWRQKGINKAVGNEKVRNRLEESKIHIKKMEKEKEDAKTVHSIKNVIGQLDDDERARRLRSFRGPDSNDNT